MRSSSSDLGQVEQVEPAGVGECTNAPTRCCLPGLSIRAVRRRRRTNSATRTRRSDCRGAGPVPVRTGARPSGSEGRAEHLLCGCSRSRARTAEAGAAEGSDLFKALRALRRILDPLDIRLGVNGARRDAWASGMQCDMGEGRVVYLLVEGKTGRPEQISTLGPARVSHVGTVEDQDRQHQQWLRSRRTAN